MSLSTGQPVTFHQTQLVLISISLNHFHDQFSTIYRGVKITHGYFKSQRF